MGWSRIRAIFPTRGSAADIFSRILDWSSCWIIIQPVDCGHPNQITPRITTVYVGVRISTDHLYKGEITNYKKREYLAG